MNTAQKLAGAVVRDSRALGGSWMAELPVAAGTAQIIIEVAPDPPHQITGLGFDVEVAVSTPVVLLNGTSSSGKSTLAKALQQELPGSWLHMAVDDFMRMAVRGGPTLDFQVGRGFAGAVAAMAQPRRRRAVILPDHHTVATERRRLQLSTLQDQDDRAIATRS